jgi:hypothetical protein
MGQQGQGRQGRAKVQAAGLRGQLWGQLGGSEDVSEGLCVSYTNRPTTNNWTELTAWM